ncbi:hypothetical protein LJC46_02230 [Desulfovibrio sp. OttesenSCG-928-G15]|nr:hypothetical protein [Desulfovibrio sp. OttesenSCG-928-G15]
MNTKADIQRELFSRLHAMARNTTIKPGLDVDAVGAFERAYAAFEVARHTANVSAMRAAAMETCAQALLVLYSIDDCWS